MTGVTHKEVSTWSTIGLITVATFYAEAVTFPAFGTTLIPVAWLPVAIFSGYLPDIDKRGTIPHNTFKSTAVPLALSTGVLTAVLGFYLSQLATVAVGIAIIAILLLMSKSLKKFQHRRETHSFIFLIFLTSVAYYISTFAPEGFTQYLVLNIALGLPIGAASHVFVDMLNVKKIHLFYPLELILGRLIYGDRTKDGKKRKKIKPFFFYFNTLKIVTKSNAEELFRKNFKYYAMGISLIISTAILFWRYVL